MGDFIVFQEKNGLEYEGKRCHSLEVRRVEATPRLVAGE